MKFKISHLLLASTAIAVSLPTAAFAQAAPEATTAESDEGIILVTARRGAEDVQGIPVSVQVVTGDDLQAQAITSVEELSKLAPGLNLVNAGSSTSVTLRGVTWQPGSGTPATPIYFNEVPFAPAETIVSMFDIGQVEVLRGPQGTTRGAASISGAVTMTTTKPNLTEFGGYIQGLYGEGNHTNVQGAVNVPIINDVLAVRFAANIEDSDGDRITSVNSSSDPSYKDRTFRATALLEPTDNLTIQGMYQYRKSSNTRFAQVVGTGSPGFTALGIPANFNGPALTLKDRKSVQDDRSFTNQRFDRFTLNASWEIFGHQITYNFGKEDNRSSASFNAVDTINALPGFEAYTSPSQNYVPTWRTHEIRISSLPSDNRPFDYDIGWFSQKTQGQQNFLLNNYLPGAFGPPSVGLGRPGLVTTPLPQYVLGTSLDIDIGQRLTNFYGNIRFHLTDATELTGGLAIISDRRPVTNAISTGAAFFPFANPFGTTLTCAQIGFTDAAYNGFCQRAIPAGVLPVENFNPKYNKALYNFSLSHKFTDDLMVYATTGTSFRSGLASINNTGLPTNLLLPEPESATSYEVGFKSSFGGTFRLNVSAFQLDYKNMLVTFEGTQFWNPVGVGSIKTTNVAFYRNIDAQVRGFEAEIGFNPADNISLGANISYSKIKSKGGSVPCNDATRPINAANPINFCTSPKGQTLNTQAPFQATINGSYELPLSDSMNGYFRFNVNYQGKNPNFGNFRQTVAGVSTFRETPSYAIVDLFAGLNGGDGAWNLGVYAKNVFDKDVELTRLDTSNTLYPLFAAPDGYDVVRANRPREVGVTVRFAFGSR